MIHKQPLDTLELVCAICSHKWSARSDGSPERCANPKCRSLKWKTGEDGRKALKVIPVRVMSERFEQFERAAKREGKTPVQWLTDLATTAVSVPVEPVRMAAEVRAAGKIVKNANGIGLDVSAFLAEKLGPPVELHPGETGPDAGIFRPLLPVDEEELDEEDSLYLEKLNREFGPHKLGEAARIHKRTWDRMTPRQQYDLLCELKERAS